VGGVTGEEAVKDVAALLSCCRRSWRTRSTGGYHSIRWRPGLRSRRVPRLGQS